MAKPEYRVEFTKTASGLKGYAVLNRKGKQVHFDESKIDAQNECDARNSKKQKPKSNSTQTKNLKKAVEAARTFIKELVKDDGDVSIHTFKDAQGGLRVSEVSVVKQRGDHGSSGYSWMRCDAGSGAGEIILAVEDVILTYDIKPYRPQGWESDIDEHADARYKLECAIKG